MYYDHHLHDAVNKKKIHLIISIILNTLLLYNNINDYTHCVGAGATST